MNNSLAVVLVHGFWHGSWCWTPVTQQLAARGIRSVAVDLDGHELRGPSPRARWSRPFDAEAFATEPSPVATVTASSATAVLAEQVRAIGGGRPCLVVAHSAGGTVATALAELAPELVGGLVYVSAFAPVNGVPAGFYMTCPENAEEKLLRLVAADPAVVGAVRIDVGAPDRRDEIKEAFYHDVDDRTADAAIALLTPDNAIPMALQQRFVSEIDAVSAAPTTVTKLDSSHSPFLSQPAALADVIAEAARVHPERS